MRRFLKFLHLLGAAGIAGGLAASAVLAVLASAWVRTPGYAPLVVAMARVAAWVVGPSMIAVVLSGLLAMAVTPGFHDALWAWAKAATGVVILETGLQVLGPLQDEAARAATAPAAALDPPGAVRLLTAETYTLWLLLAVSLANTALGVWRPRLARGRTARKAPS